MTHPLLAQEFLIPLRKSPSMVAVPFIEKKDLQIIFCNVEQLERLSAEMADELERARDGQAVAAVFMRNIPRASDYMEYCANYDRAIERIDHLKAAKPEYTKFIRVCLFIPLARNTYDKLYTPLGNC